MGKMTNQYLKETKMLDYSHKSIQKLISERKWSDFPEKERVKKIYNFVKDEILFGYNTDDKIKASKVLKDGFGQCNTKGTLFMALLRACGVPCRVHGFTIDKALQKGAMTGIVYKSAPKEIFHSTSKFAFAACGTILKGSFSTKPISVLCKNGSPLEKTARLLATALRRKILQVRQSNSIVATRIFKRKVSCATSAYTTIPTVF